MHRMCTVDNADKIMVLENGSMAETDSPEELKNVTEYLPAWSKGKLLLQIKLAFLNLLFCR